MAKTFANNEGVFEHTETGSSDKIYRRLRTIVWSRRRTPTNVVRVMSSDDYSKGSIWYRIILKKKGV